MTARPITEGEREKLIALEKNATPGPWSAELGAYVHTDWTVITARGEGMTPNSPLAVIGAISNLLGAEEAMKDAAFIAAMRNALPALLSTSSEVRRLREALEKIARQTLSVDMSVDDQLGGDFEGAYNYMIEDARAALSVEGEDGRATRSQGLATAPTDRL